LVRKTTIAQQVRAALRTVAVDERDPAVRGTIGDAADLMSDRGCERLARLLK
jgi:hypothetical protein